MTRANHTAPSRLTDCLGVPIDPTGIPLAMYMGLSKFVQSFPKSLHYHRDRAVISLLVRDITDGAAIQTLKDYGFKRQQRLVGAGHSGHEHSFPWIDDWLWLSNRDT